MQNVFKLLIFTIVILLNDCQTSASSNDYDIVIYGGTSAGLTAAVQAVKMGKSVIIVSPDKHLGGLSHEFYHRIWKHYDSDDAWKWQKKSEYGNKGQQNSAIDSENSTMWIFEPQDAEKVFELSKAMKDKYCL